MMLIWALKPEVAFWLCVSFPSRIDFSAYIAVLLIIELFQVTDKRIDELIID